MPASLYFTDLSLDEQKSFLYLRHKRRPDIVDDIANGFSVIVGERYDLLDHNKVRKESEG